MLALLSVWLGLASLGYALGIVFWRRLFNDPGVTATLYAAIFSLTFAGLTLWDLRKAPRQAAGVPARRTQAVVGVCLSLTSIAIIYLLVDRAEVLPRGGD